LLIGKSSETSSFREITGSIIPESPSPDDLFKQFKLKRRTDVSDFLTWSSGFSNNSKPVLDFYWGFFRHQGHATPGVNCLNPVTLPVGFFPENQTILSRVNIQTKSFQNRNTNYQIMFRVISAS